MRTVFLLTAKTQILINTHSANPSFSVFDILKVLGELEVNQCGKVKMEKGIWGVITTNTSAASQKWYITISE